MSKQAFVALVTCFNEDETINYEATRAQARRQWRPATTSCAPAPMAISPR